MAIGTSSVTGRLISALAGSDFELVCPSELLEALILLKRGRFDLVTVDCPLEAAEATCHRLSKAGDAPVVLMVGQKQRDWKRMRSLDVDGYIPDEVNGPELAARLKAVSRRLQPPSDLRNEPLAGAQGES